MAEFALLESPILISRKIWMIGKSWNFHPLLFRKKLATLNGNRCTKAFCLQHIVPASDHRQNRSSPSRKNGRINIGGTCDFSRMIWCVWKSSIQMLSSRNQSSKAGIFKEEAFLREKILSGCCCDRLFSTNKVLVWKWVQNVEIREFFYS